MKLGIHIPTNEKVAIKILHKSKIEESSNLEMIFKEIKILKKLNHINIIKLFEVFICSVQ